MDILFNDLSLQDNQFPDVGTFCEALGRVMKMQRTAGCNGRKIYCHLGFANVRPVNNMSIYTIINKCFKKDKIRDVTNWISKGPHWDSSESRQHSKDNQIECKGASVTGSALAEAAVRQSRSVSDCGLVSLEPSDWNYTPLTVKCRHCEGGIDDEVVEIKNWWETDALERDLRSLQAPIQSWLELKDQARRQYRFLDFAEDCFEKLEPIPFAHHSAEKALRLFEILNQLASEYDEKGRRTDEGYKIHRDYFEGDNAWFSDSSDTEKNKMKDALTFTAPDGTSVICSWHGKFNHPHSPMRFHFTWPVNAREKIFVAYIGPKLTLR